MSKEKIIYRFRYREPYEKRRKIPYLDRTMQLVREVHYANSIRSYEVFKHIFTTADRLMVEGVLGEFPQRVIGYEQDSLKEGVEHFINELKNEKVD